MLRTLRRGFLLVAFAGVAIVPSFSISSAAAAANECVLSVGPMHEPVTISIHDVTCWIAKTDVLDLYRSGIVPAYPKFDSVLGWRCRLTRHVYSCAGLPRYSSYVSRASMIRFRWPSALPTFSACVSRWDLSATGTDPANSVDLVFHLRGLVNPEEPCSDLHQFAVVLFNTDGFPAPANGWTPWGASTVGPDEYTRHFAWPPPNVSPNDGNQLPTGSYSCKEFFTAQTSLGALTNPDGGPVESQGVSTAFMDRYVCSRVARYRGGILRDEELGLSISTDQAGALTWYVASDASLVPFGPPYWQDCAQQDWCPGPPATKSLLYVGYGQDLS